MSHPATQPPSHPATQPPQPPQPPQKKSWTKPTIRLMDDGIRQTHGGSQAGTTENSAYFFQS